MKKLSEITKILIQSSFLDLRDYVTLCWILRRPKDWIEFVQYFPFQQDGKVRLKFWYRALQSVIFSEVFYMRRAIAEMEHHENLEGADFYDRCLAQVDFTEVNRFSTGTPGEIFRDVMRTFQTMKLFQEDQIGQLMLTHILLAISIARPEVGYCQGMNFVTGTLILSRCNIWDPEQTTFNADQSPITVAEMHEMEKEIFEFLLALINKNGKIAMQGLWGAKIPRLKLRVYQLDRFLRWNYPHLHDHFVKINLSPEVLTAQWFVTLYSYSFPSNMTIRLWDYICLAGWEGIFRLAVSILGLMQDQLLALEDMESVALLMKEWKKPGYLVSFFSFEQLLAKAASLIINEEVLLKLQESYAQEVLSMAVIVKYYQDHPDPTTKNGFESPYDLTQASIVKKALPLGVEPPTFWLMRYGYKLSDQQAYELDAIYHELLLMDQQVNQDKQVLQNKIVKACEFHRAIEEHIHQVLIILSEITEQLHQSQQEFHHAVEEAQLIANKAAVIIDTLGDKAFVFAAEKSPTSSTHSDGNNNTMNSNGGIADHTATTTSTNDSNMTKNDSLSSSTTAVTTQTTTTTSTITTTTATTTSSSSPSSPVAPNGASSSSSLAPWKLLHEGPIRKFLFKKKLAGAKHMTDSLNEVLDKALRDQFDEEDEEGEEEEVDVSDEEQEDTTLDDNHEKQDDEEAKELNPEVRETVNTINESEILTSFIDPTTRRQILSLRKSISEDKEENVGEEEEALGNEDKEKHSSIDLRHLSTASDLPAPRLAISARTPSILVDLKEMNLESTQRDSATTSSTSESLTTGIAATSHNVAPTTKAKKLVKKRLSNSSIQSQESLTSNRSSQSTVGTTPSSPKDNQILLPPTPNRKREVEEAREQIVQQVRRLSQRIDHFAATTAATFGNHRSERFSFTTRDSGSGNNPGLRHASEDSFLSSHESSIHPVKKESMFQRLTARKAKKEAISSQTSTTVATTTATSTKTMKRTTSTSSTTTATASINSSQSSSSSFFSSLEQRVSNSLESFHTMISQSLFTNTTPMNTENTTTSSSTLNPKHREKVMKKIEKPTTSTSLISQSCQLQALEAASSKAQQRIVTAHKTMDHHKKALAKYQLTLEELKMKEDELNIFKKSLCDQLQLLVEDSNRGRSQKLLFVSEAYTV